MSAVMFLLGQERTILKNKYEGYIPGMHTTVNRIWEKS